MILVGKVAVVSFVSFCTFSALHSQYEISILFSDNILEYLAKED